MNEESNSGIVDGQFLSETDLQPVYEEVGSHGFNAFMKVKRQGRWFMLKGLAAEYRQEPLCLELLKKEFELLRQLDHPNIVRAYAKEVDEVLGPCILMEYVDSVTLNKFLATKPSAETRRKIVDQLLDALCYIHSKQVIHRDLKPSNVLITANGNNVKIIDFGLSDSDDYAILKQSAGTLKYMAPEQRTQDGKMDARTDIYAFGLLLLEIFPHRYRRIAAKCTREDQERRYAHTEAVKKAFRRRGFLLPVATLLIGMALAAVPSVLLKPKEIVRTEVQHVIDTIIVERNPNGYSDEFMQLLDRAEIIIDSMYNPVIEDIKNGRPIIEVTNDMVERGKTCRSLLMDIQSPLLEDRKADEEFRSAWEHLYSDKYNMVVFMLNDVIQAEQGN